MTARLKPDVLARLQAIYSRVRFVGKDVLPSHPAAITSIRGRPILFLRRRRDVADLADSVRWALAPAQRKHAAECRRQVRS